MNFIFSGSQAIVGSIVVSTSVIQTKTIKISAFIFDISNISFCLRCRETSRYELYHIGE